MHIHDATESAFKNGLEQGKLALCRSQTCVAISDYEKLCSILKNRRVEAFPYAGGTVVSIGQAVLIFDEHGSFVEIRERQI